MSMREYAYEDYGLVLELDVMKYICTRKFPEDEYDEDDDVVQALYDTDFCTCAGQFTGEAFYINDDGRDDWNCSQSYSCDELYYIPFGGYPSLFKAPYNSIDEIVDEFKEKIGEFMPPDYDYRANLKHIIGTVWG